MSVEPQESREEEPMTGTGAVNEREPIERVAVGPGAGAAAGEEATDAAEQDAAAVPDDGAADDPVPAPALSGADASLLALVDRLSAVLERSDLGELEVAAGGTTIVLRAPSAIERAPAAAASAEPPTPEVASAPVAAPMVTPGAAADAAPPSVKAPLTGIYYGAPSPGATPYVAVDDHVSVGQIIGLIEAMKLFNEIKSDLAGRVVRVCVDNGALVKAKQPLIEVEPA
jgi:acetyl-CoA carboxylase biotin carboxyl carrier protein